MRNGSGGRAVWEDAAPVSAQRASQAPIRVAFVYDHLYPYTVGGAERYYWTLARALAAEQPVSMLTRRFWDGPAVRTDEGVELVGLVRVRRGRFGPKLLFGLALLWHLLVRGGRYDVVHCCCFPHLALVAARLGLAPRPGTKLVADWHEVLPRSTWRRRLGRLGELGYLAQRLAIRSGDCAIAFSRMHVARLREEGRGEPIRLLPEFLPEVHAPERPELGARENLIVFAGRLVAEKRAELLPPVVRELRRRDPSWRAIVFGAGPDEDRVTGAIAASGVEGAVRMAGFAPWREVSDAMLAARALVFPTTREGFGLVVLEAAAHGLPAVLVAGGDNAAVELIEPGENGVVLESAEPERLAAAVLELAADEAVHARTRRWFDAASRRYSVDNAARELRALHEALLGTGGPSAASSSS